MCPISIKQRCLMSGNNKKFDNEIEYFFNMPEHLLAVAGTDGYFKSYSPAFEALMQYDQSELLLRPFLDFVHPDDYQRTQAEAEKVYSSVETVRFENRFQCKDGTYRWFSWHANLLGDKIFCVAQDITERKISEEKLKNSEAEFRKMCELMPQIVWTSEPSGNVDYYNNHWFEYTGMNLEETQGWGWKPVIHPDDLQNCIDRWTHSIATGENYEVEYRFKRGSDGQYRWHLGRAVPSRDMNGKIVKWFGTCTDIDDQKKASAILESLVEERTVALKAANLALVQSAKMTALGEMAGGIAHEINNPLAIISLSTQIIRSYLAQISTDHPLLHVNIERIDATSKRIAKIIDGLRSFSRESDIAPREITTVGDMIGTTLSLCREKFAVHGIELRLDPYDVELQLSCNSVQISQVLLNLLNNSFYAVQKLPVKWIQIQVVVVDEFVQIAVTDSGSGIPEEIQKNIFQPFYTTKPQGHGTGLGLSISKGIIQSHQGDLYIDSECVNTRFVFAVPLRTESDFGNFKKAS